MTKEDFNFSYPDLVTNIEEVYPKVNGTHYYHVYTCDGSYYISFTNSTRSDMCAWTIYDNLMNVKSKNWCYGSHFDEFYDLIFDEFIKYAGPDIIKSIVISKLPKDIFDELKS